MTTTQQAPRPVRAPGTVRVDALEALAHSWMASSHRGSSTWECGVSLLGVLAAATDDGRAAAAAGGAR